VKDAASTLVPRVADQGARRPGGLGLNLVEWLSSGVAKDGAGVTRDWSEIVLVA
jgi:hypothetical protein